ncbi:MAG: metalloregulator ArsR/SmtB family transcription factor [Bacillota bacterium]|nr:metalloregulator ArsR/SmtB family transcription factor [Bacillota bacterium]
MANKYTCDCEMIHEEVVERVSESMATKEEYQKLAALFKAFGDSTRAQILNALEQEEMCVCDISSMLDMTKSAVSHQLKNLRMMNLVKFRKEGQVVYYSLADDHVKDILEIGFQHINE